MKKAFFALKMKNSGLLKECIENGFDASFDNNWPIRYASEFGHTEVVKFLSTLQNVDASTMHNLVIQVASRNGHLDVVKFLSTLPSVDVCDLDNFAIVLASEKYHFDIVNFLLTLDSVRNSLSKEDLRKYQNQAK